PCLRSSAAGDAAREKSGWAAALTLSESVAVRASTPVPVARTVIEAWPTAADAPAARVSVLLVWPAAMDAGEKLPVTPDGAPSTASDTAPVKPPLRDMVTVTVPLAPCATARLPPERV